MNFYCQTENDDLAKTIIRSLEEETGNKIFTIFFTRKQPDEKKLAAYVVFKNKDILEMEITVENIEGKLTAARMRGNYL